MPSSRPETLLRYCAFLFFCINTAFNVHAQKKAHIWAFSDYELDFNDPSVTVKREFASHLNRGMGVISDDDGQLLFYTDGYTVWNKVHNRMPNGFDLLPSHLSTSTQESIVIPKPGSSNIFYIFTVDPWNGQTTSGLYFAEVDLSLDNGLGDVTVKGVKLVNNTTNALSAVFHRNKKDIWLITHQHNTSKYFVVQITEGGVLPEIIEQQIGSSHSFWGGQLKFSPDGRKVAVSYDEFKSGVSLFDFDNETGMLSNAMEFSFQDLDSSPIIGGLEFSSDATKLYTYELRYGTVIQFDISRSGYEAINDSRYVIPERVNYNGFRQFQLAPDGRIYITKGGGGGGTGHLGVIENPNADGNEVIVRENGLYLEGGDSFVNYTPNFIQNYFFKTSFNYRGSCQRTPVEFYVTNEQLIDSVKWQFGEGSTSELRNPVIQYESPGEYMVTLLAYYSGRADTVSRRINIDPYTSFDLGEDFAVCRGDKLTADAGFDSYAWNTGDTTRSTLLNLTQWYKLVARNDFGCFYRDSVFVTVKELPVIDLPDTVKFADSPSVQLDAGDFSDYSWSTGESTRTITVSQTGWYSVSVQNADGCSSAKSIFVGDSRVVPSTDEWVWLNPLPSGKTGTDICFVNDQTGFIVNGSTILRTTDGGQTWEEQMAVTSANRVAFKDQIGFVVGNNGSVYRSTHNGGGWNKINFAYNDNLNAVTVIHPDTVIITSDRRLFVTHDGGRNWTARDIPGVDVEDSFFTSSKTGHAGCKSGTILKTIDGGITWRVTFDSNVFPSDFFKITFVGSDVGYATREHFYIYKSTDGGETWHEIATPYDAIYGMHFLNEDVGYITGEHGVIHKTQDGGSTWTWAGFLNGRYDASDMNGVYFLDENNGFAVGFRGRIMRTYNGGQTWQSYAPTYNSINDLIFPSPSVGYALGDRVYKTTDHGITWTPLDNDIVDKSWHYQAGYFLSERTGFVTTSNYYGTKVLHTDDGGETWTDTPVPGTILSFVDDQTWFAGGSVVYKTRDAGLHWEFVSSFSASDMHFIDESKGFAIRYGDLYKTVDGGKTWAITYEVYGYLTEIDFVNDEVGYISAEYGIVLKTTDGGETWEEKETEYDHLLAVDFITENIGFVSGEYGRHFSTADGGNTWTRYHIPAQIRSISLTSENKCFVGGLYGSLLSRAFTYPAFLIKALKAVSVTANAAELTGVIASNATIVENAQIEYGLNATFSNATPLTPGSVTVGKNNEYRLHVENLLPDTVYSFRLKATVNGTIQFSNVIQFRTLPLFVLPAPSAGEVGPTTAELWARVVSNMNEITNLKFEYDTISSFQTRKVVDSNPATVAAGAQGYVLATLEGLRPSTKYYLRLNGTHNGKVHTSNVAMLKTLPEYRISFLNPLPNGNEVTLRAQVTSNEHAITNLQFEYGLSRLYNSIVASEPSGVNGNASNVVGGIAEVPHPDSIYFYRLTGLYNGKRFYSTEGVFRLSGGIILVAEPAADISPTSATLNGLVGRNGEYLYNVFFEYGPTPSLGDTARATALGPISNVFNITAALQDLTEDTDYYFRIAAMLWDGTVHYSSAKTFRTDVITGISDHSSNGYATLYPNPATDEVTLISQHIIDRVELLDAMGREVYTSPAEGFSCTLALSRFSPGIYYIRIVQAGKTLTRKLIKK